MTIPSRRFWAEPYAPADRAASCTNRCATRAGGAWACSSRARYRIVASENTFATSGTARGLPTCSRSSGSSLPGLERNDPSGLSRADRVHRTRVDEVSLGGRPIDRLGARVGFAFGVEAHEVRRHRYAQAATNALVAVDPELEATARIDAARLIVERLDVLERLVRRAPPLVDRLIDVAEAEPILSTSRTDQHHRRPAPMGERILLQRMHHRGRRAHVNVGEAERECVVNRPKVGAADVDRDDEIRVERRDGDGQVVDHAAVDAETIADLSRREVARQGA